jgi:hypothetical protein
VDELMADHALLEAQSEVRDEVCEALAADLIGPAGQPDEILHDRPLDRYITGILYPRLGSEAQVEKSEVDEVADDDGERSADPAIAMTNVHYPSSAGITFAVAAGTKKLSVYVTTAQYVSLEGDRWQRRAIEPPSETINVDEVGSYSRCLSEGLSLYVRVRSPIEGAASVSVILLNEQQGKSGEKDATSFFQVGFKVRGLGGETPFVARPGRLEIDDQDLRSNELIYRDRPEFAIGHGCAAEWTQDANDPRRASSVSATFRPSHEVPIVESNPEIEMDRLRFADLAEASTEDLIISLMSFLSGYEEWIKERQGTVASLDERYGETAAMHLRECARARDRIKAGIEFLRDDSDALRAFRLANLAMVDQLSRRELSAGEEGNRRQFLWRPFQLAFVLLSMPSAARRSAPDRTVVELLWFPTGGGKTEAYLALFAFTTFYRRLTLGGAAGVTAIMRYTLRLLTTQQFERATRVVCACERIRRAESDLGSEPISIGLFVGAASTPNTLDEARDSLNSLRAGNAVATKNPMQLGDCPWCEKQLSPINYVRREDPRRLQIECRNPGCDFSQGLPVFVVDEDIYREHPTLLIGTVDKFAALPWRPDVGNLFNLDRSDLPPPDLIIQDELHLISGPLGTMTGLYETVVDVLGTEAGEPPKVIASTATIRRAQEQSRGLFAREMRQFPPPGIDPDDNWFATVAPPSRRGPRRYVGLMAAGVSQATLMIRAYAALLDAAARPEPGPAVDPYWTLIGYFNSLRVLGAARMQVQDDVQDRLRLLSGGDEERRRPEAVELTSRTDSASIPQRLRELEWPMMAADDAAEMKMPGLTGADPNAKRAIDILLATNMISVGVDIDRLGLMVMMGQPQAAAEYIQASSRVGRRHPGLVVVLLNAARSRDRSHYEGFTAFHDSLYRAVEPTSVTPFSPRARDRGLHAVLIALARLRIPGLRANEAAANIDAHLDDLEAIIELILDRVRVVDSDQVEATEAQLREIVDRWQQRAEAEPGLVYSSFKEDRPPTLMTTAGPDFETREEMPTMWSLRDVDAESNFYFAKRR